MQTVADRPEAPTAIRTDLGAIFVSLELSRSTWLITSLWPGGGEKMSKQVVRGGDVAELLERFARLREKARARTGKVFLFVVIQEAGLDGFWIDRTCLIQKNAQASQAGNSKGTMSMGDVVVLREGVAPKRQLGSATTASSTWCATPS